MVTINGDNYATGATGTVLTGNGVGTTPTFQAAGAGAAFSIINIQTFAASGTYTPTANMKYCIIELVGGGGGGGSSVNTTATTISFAGGGGPGGYARKFASAATIGVSQTVTCGAGGTAGGAGGTSSVGTLCVASGGQPGTATSFITTTYLAVNGGGSGVGTTGDVKLQGQPGFCGTGSSTSGQCSGGNGGASYFGGGGLAFTGTSQQAGSNGLNGGGGGGSFTGLSGSGGVGQSGGSGGVGYVVITEFI